MYLSLEIIKTHLNIDPDFNEDDEYLLHLEEACEVIVERHIDRKLSELCLEVTNGEGETTLTLPRPLLHAILFMIGNLYANREPVSYASTMQVPLSYDYILSLYKNYSNEGGVID